jgi:NAD(P)-dependent dehydrogenase (short-subunit alcohol dehydrogenase family)
MVERGYGRIINIGSQAGHVGIKRNAAYCASKGGVEALTKVHALECGPRGITLNAVAPGFIRTTVNAEAIDRPEFVEEVSPEFRLAAPVRRPMLPPPSCSSRRPPPRL